MQFFPDFSSLDGILSIIFFIMATIIVHSKISIRFQDYSDSKIKRVLISFMAGFGIGALIASYGAILAFLNFLSINSYWTAITTFMALSSVSFKDIYGMLFRIFNV